MYLFMIKDIFCEFKVDEFKPYKLNSNLSNFDIDESLLLYFEDCNSTELNEYTNKEISKLTSVFSEVGKKFINISKVRYPQNIDVLLKYYIPHLLLEQNIKVDFARLFIEDIAVDLIEDCEVRNINRFNKTHKILNYLGYGGSIRSGFVLLEYEKGYVIECNDLHFIKLNLKPFEKLIRYFKQVESSKEREFNSRRGGIKVNQYENIDDDTLTKIKQINSQIEALKNSGQLIVALPILKKILDSSVNAIDLRQVSTIQVDENYNIVLPYFNNLEVPLSHLTKVVYLLFYYNPNGIDIKELHLYEAELKELYLKVSNQLDYDKMVQSISDLVSPDSKAIYTHISRIKSAFYKLMDKFYADNYIIVGEGFGSSSKYIPILLEISYGSELGREDF